MPKAKLNKNNKEKIHQNVIMIKFYFNLYYLFSSTKQNLITYLPFILDERITENHEPNS